MDFKVQLKKYQEQVNNELEKYSGKKDVPEKILNNSMEYSLMAGGKRDSDGRCLQDRACYQ